MCKADAAACSLRANLRIGLERAFTRGLLIDDWSGIGLAEFDAGGVQFKRRCGPWLMDQACRQARELRHPAPDIGAVGIELLALQDRIEDPEIGRGVGARTG